MGETKQKKSNGFVIQGAILASASIIVRLIGIIYRIPLTNIIGDQGNALYSVAFEVYSIALLLSSYSLPIAVSKLVASRVSIKERTNAYRVFKGAMVFAASVGLIVSFSIFFGADYIAGTIMKASMSAYALKVLAPCLFMVAVLGVMRGYCQGVGTTVPTAISQILEQIINAIVSVVAASLLFKAGTELAAATGDELYAAAYGAAGGTLGTASGALIALVFMGFVLYVYRPVVHRQMKRERMVELESYGVIFKILMLTILPIVFSTAIYNISGILDQGIYTNIMANQGISEDEYLTLWGIYTGKYKVLLNVPLGVSNAFAASIIPSIAAAVALKSKKEVRDKTSLAIRLSMVIAIPCCFAFLFLGSPILELLFNDTAKVPQIIMAMGSVSVIFYCLSTLTNAILQGTNHMTTPIKHSAISLGVHLLALWLMMSVFKWGIYAVVLSNVIFSLMMCVLNQLALRKYLRYRQEFKKTFLLPMISALAMSLVGVALLFGLRFVMPDRIAIALVIVVAGVIYLIGLLVTGALTEADVYQMPKGGQIARILRKTHLLKADMME